jgi:hypothetical protein
MAIPRWSPPQAPTRQEQFLLKRLERNRKLFGFLRLYRHELLDDAFQAELESMYRDTGAGLEPKPPALLAMVMLLQGYTGASDADAVELSIVDLRWQMVLGCLGASEPVFSQGALFEFRQRMIRHDMDQRLLERTRELAHRTKGFDPHKLPKTLRVAVDSAPLEGAGRVEDTVNLLGHAARKVVGCVSLLLGWDKERVCREAGIPLLLESSVKAALDVQWSNPAEKPRALERLVAQLDSLEAWLAGALPEEVARPPLRDTLELLRQLRAQDLEPDPKGGGKTRIRRGTATDRRISVEDPDMRHGRKTKTKRFNGYKRHIALDLDEGLILACAVLPANRPEAEAVPPLRDDLARQALTVDELYIDRGYITSVLVDEVLRRRGEVICRPWVARNRGRFTKADFTFNLRDRTVTCPAGQSEHFVPGHDVEFDRDLCASCLMRPQCTTNRTDGRSLQIAADELLQERLRRQAATPAGRTRLRGRTPIEHRLSHVVRKQGRRARYRGQRKNLFDLRRAASVVNLERVQLRNQLVRMERKAA